jgi:hypothetical protein
MEIGFDNITEHFIPVTDFPSSWRFNCATKMNRFSIVLLATSCLVYFFPSVLVAQKRTIKCRGFQDTLLQKFVYRVVDQPPVIVGGMETLYKKLAKFFKYPKGASDYNGKVQVAFVIEPNGKIDGKRTIYDPSGKEHLFSKQIFSIIDHIKWQPGRCDKKVVPVLYILPVTIDFEE